MSLGRASAVAQWFLDGSRFNYPDCNTMSNDRTYAIDSQMQWYSVVKIIESQSRHPTSPWFLQAQAELVEFASARRFTISKSDPMFRARAMPPAGNVGPPGKFDCANMSAPPADRCPGGRLNPPGLPYLYLARERDTAVAESRPWTGEFLSVGTFTAQVEIQLYDLTLESDEGTVANFIYRQLAEAFARPAHPASAYAYAATQFFAEILKEAGQSKLLGIQYRSAMHAGGHNVALFGGIRPGFDALVKCQSTELRCVTSVQVSSEEVTGSQ